MSTLRWYPCLAAWLAAYGGHNWAVGLGRAHATAGGACATPVTAWSTTFDRYRIVLVCRIITEVRRCGSAEVRRCGGAGYPMKPGCDDRRTDEPVDLPDVGDSWRNRLETLRQELARATDDRRRAECSARIQSDAIQRALDFLVRESDIDKFFTMFMQSLVEESESCACGVWLLDDQGKHCDLWMAFIDNHPLTRESAEWDAIAFPREHM